MINTGKLFNSPLIRRPQNNQFLYLLISILKLFLTEFRKLGNCEAIYVELGNNEIKTITNDTTTDIKGAFSTILAPNNTHRLQDLS